MSAKASARKSLGEFKPLIVYADGSTEVCEKSEERYERNVRYAGRVETIPGKRYARGTTYATRDEAIAAAQATIDARRVDAEARLTKFRAWLATGNCPATLANTIAKVEAEVAFWSGEAAR